MASVPLTLPSHASILTGQYPPTHGVRHNAVFVLARRRRDDRRALLAARLRDRRRGRRRGARPGLRPRPGLRRLRRRHLPKERASAAGFFERPAKEVTDRALAWLAGTNGPFFLWVHYYDVHATYNPPEPFKTRFRRHLYDGEVANVDQELGRLLAGLEQQGRLANTDRRRHRRSRRGARRARRGDAHLLHLRLGAARAADARRAGRARRASVSGAWPRTPASRRPCSRLAGVRRCTSTDVGDLAPLWREGARRARRARRTPRRLAGELDHGWAPLHAHSHRSLPLHPRAASRALRRRRPIRTSSANLLPSELPEPVAVVRSDEARIDALLARRRRAAPRSPSMPRRARASRRSATWCPTARP